MGAYHRITGVHMIHSSEGASALDIGHHSDVEEQTDRGLDPGTDLGGNRDHPAVEAIWGCGATELCQP